MAQWYEAAYFTMAEVGVQVQIPAGQLAGFLLFLFLFFFCFLFSFMVFLPFGLFPFILFFPF